jgi:hypothetical protein
MSAVFSKRSAELAKKNFVDAAVKVASTNKKPKAKQQEEERIRDQERHSAQSNLHRGRDIAIEQETSSGFEQ